MDAFILGVPADDAPDLAALVADLGLGAEFTEQRYFDGALFAETLLPLVLSGSAWWTLRTWIKSRAEVLKATRVAVGGIEITGMNSKDAERIIRALSSHVNAGEIEHDLALDEDHG